MKAATITGRTTIGVQPRIFGILLFGPSPRAADLRTLLAQATFHVGERTGNWSQLTYIGDPRQSEGNFRTYTEELLGQHSTAEHIEEWKRSVDQLGSAETVIQREEEELRRALNIEPDQVPCLALGTIPGFENHRVLSIEEACWSDLNQQKKLVEYLCTILEEQRVAALLRETRNPSTPLNDLCDDLRNGFEDLAKTDLRIGSREGEKRSGTRGRGRPRHHATPQEWNIQKAWASGSYPTYAELAAKLSTTDRPVSKRDVKLAVERGRGAKRRQRGK